jgi:YVTN family beta-propeller protein
LPDIERGERMRTLARSLAIVMLLGGCRTVAPQRPAGPLGEEGMLHLYVQPFPADADRLAFALSAVAALREDGSTVPLALALSDLSGRDTRHQRLLARGRLPAGNYAGLLLQARSATLAGERDRADLLVAEPHRIAAPFTVRSGRHVVRWLELALGEALQQEYAFKPAFAVIDPPVPNPDLLAFSLGDKDDGVTVLDRTRRQVVGVVATGPSPRGLAFDARLARLYVALPASDEVQILDALTGAELTRIQLDPGDEPHDLALAQDGRLVIVSNLNSGTVSFVDAAAALQVARADVGEEPGRILVGRDGRRAYVVNGRSGSVSALDVANRAVERTGATEAEPTQLAQNRAGTRLYVLHDSSPYMLVLAVPDLTLVSRVFVGLGARALRVDPRTDLLFVARREEGRLQVFDPFSFIPIAAPTLPDAGGEMVIDDAQGLLLVALPERGSVAFVDLSRRETVSVADVLPEPARLAVTGERR